MAEPEVRAEGVTVLSEGVDPLADIVFIHGLQGHPEKTWTYGEKNEPTRSKHSLSKLLGRKKQSQTATETSSSGPSSVFWPKSLLAKDFPNARVMTYGYDSAVSKFFQGPANQSGILAHSESLLNALEVERRDCRQRPIVFLTHSLGGIILKQALVGSKAAMEDEQGLRDIYQSTYAIVFFGTPHRGSSYANLGVLARDIVVAAGFDARDVLVRSLKPDTEMLTVLRKEFARMLYDKAFKIHSFQEGQGLTGFSVASRKVVDDDSSRLDDAREGHDHINGNHMMMCRFRGADDEGYRKVKGVVSRYFDEIQAKVIEKKEQLALEQKLLAEKTAKEQARLSEKWKILAKEIRHSLRTAHMNERVGEVANAHPRTFDWIFTSSETGFLDWLHSNEGLFWITGKPGSGKSTLMKYLIQEPRTQEGLSQRGLPILAMPAFFFHARGVETEKSFDGLLRSILFQLLYEVPELVESVADIYEKDMEIQGHCSWTISQLEKGLDNIRERRIKGCICLFIDALDEYAGRSEDIARFVKSLAVPTDEPADERLVIKVCASSRPWTTFISLLKETPSFAIQDWTKGDIKEYAADRLEGCERDGTADILHEITERADGVFLWVKLVLDEIWQPLCDGKRMESIEALLSKLPDDLPKFYVRMVENVSTEDLPILMCMLELVLCSDYLERHFNLEQFSLVVDLFQRGSSATENVGLTFADDNRRCSEVKRRIRACSGGLLEVTDSRVQFTHQTVKSFIGDPQNSGLFKGLSTTDLALSGVHRMMQLMIRLIGQMDSTMVWTGIINYRDEGFVHPNPPRSFPNFDYRVILGFAMWALVGERAFGSANNSLIKDFYTAVRQHCGEQWLGTWWNAAGGPNPSLNSKNPWVRGSLPPSSLLEFALQLDLLLFVEQELSEEISRNPKVFRDPRLLYFMAVGNADSDYADLSFVYHSPQRWRDFAGFLLQNGFDPNMMVKITLSPDHGYLMNNFEEKDASPRSDEHSDGNDDEHSGENDDEHSDQNDGEEGDRGGANGDDSITEKPQSIAIMHLALAMACTKSVFGRRAYNGLNMLRVLVEGGGDAKISNYRNLWGSEGNTHVERSAVHYLLSLRFDWAMPFKSKEPEDNRALAECITAFLNHGTDPNTVDSNGVSILECGLPVCPPQLIELMLEKGGKITPKLLLESGKPVDYGEGILNEPRWRRPEYYTAEARVLARKNNPDWPNFEDERNEEQAGDTEEDGDAEQDRNTEQDGDTEQGRDTEQDTGILLHTGQGLLGNLVASIRRIVAR